jgi:hypothetical protein
MLTLYFTLGGLVVEVVVEDVEVIVVNVVVVDDVEIVVVVDIINVAVEVSSDEMSTKVDSGSSVIVRSLDGCVFR